MTAAGLGLEPRYTDSESAVLPLDDPAMIKEAFSCLPDSQAFSSIAGGLAFEYNKGKRAFIQAISIYYFFFLAIAAFINSVKRG